jgi:Ca-activated chloride channel family protein
MDKVLPDDPVAGLIDIPLPHAVSLWPATWPLRIVIALVLVALAVTGWRAVRAFIANRYRREALKELSRITGASQVSAASTADALAVLVRRTALAVFPREQIAPLSGAAWLAFLDRSYGGEDFSRGAGRLLESAAYDPRPVTAADVASLTGLVRRWIDTHHA